MFEITIERIRALLGIVPFTAATWSVLLVLVFFGWLFSRADKDPTSPVKWEHLVVDSSNDRVSPFKMGYLIGGLVGTWIVVSLADGKALTYDIFGMYLTYLLGGAGMNTFFRIKGGEDTPNNLTEPEEDPVIKKTK